MSTRHISKRNSPFLDSKKMSCHRALSPDPALESARLRWNTFAQRSYFGFARRKLVCFIAIKILCLFSGCASLLREPLASEPSFEKVTCSFDVTVQLSVSSQSTEVWPRLRGTCFLLAQGFPKLIQRR